jgi:hypothetical protein
MFPSTGTCIGNSTHHEIYYIQGKTTLDKWSTQTLNRHRLNDQCHWLKFEAAFVLSQLA